MPSGVYPRTKRTRELMSIAKKKQWRRKGYHERVSAVASLSGKKR